MIDRRLFLGSLTASAATHNTMFQARAATSEPDEAFFAGTADDNGFQYRSTEMSKIAPRYRRQLVKYLHKEPPGSIVVDTKAHALYVTFENNTALRYGVGVGKEGFQWFGRAEVGRKAIWPDWTPPAEMLVAVRSCRSTWRADPTTRSARARTTSIETART